jgi:hypothetical protein
MVVLIIGIALLLGSAVAWGVIRKRRSEGLRRRFGAEYGHALRASGSRGRAEADLTSRTKRVERLGIHPLSSRDHERLTERWGATQASFVDDPAGAVSAAEMLVEEVLRARGYPVGDFDQRAADISVDHPRFVGSYREARELALAIQRGAAKTEDLRQAAVQYRALFDDLLETSEMDRVSQFTDSERTPL